MAKSVAAARIGSFHFMSASVILAKCLGTAHPRATALHSANCRPILMPCPSLGHASGARPSTMLIRGTSLRIGPCVCRLEIDLLHADTVRLIYRLALKGDGTSGQVGVRSITAHLNRQRIFTRPRPARGGR